MSEKRHTEKVPREPIARRSRRRLTADEERLWATVARSIKPLRTAKPAPGPAPAARPAADAGPAAERVAPEHALPPVVRPTKPAAPTTLARRERQQIARGKAALGGRIDLHGMTQAEAHDALLAFLRRKQAQGEKFVLVITGKGAATGRDRGVLRRQVPLWLALPTFRACVLGFDVAHAGHGGEGALYVRLRKARG